ncbi:MAG: MATE family efflux transporter [Clostridia bacterium]|nr:MATE family efflux transporter [Clostridia bacterium]
MTASAGRIDIFERLPIKRAVLLQIIPAIASQMITLLYNLADTYFVGMLNDPGETAAVTVGYASFVFLTAISNLFGVGGASALARSLGRGEKDAAGRISSVAFWLGAFSSLLFSLIFLLFQRPLLMICGADADTLELAVSYTTWAVVIGGPATILNVLLANLIRAEGSAAHASIGVSIGGIANIILDPIFILPTGLGLGALGAGAATALSNLISTIYFIALIFIKRKRTIISLSIKKLRYTGVYLKSILSVGFPSALQYALTVVAVSAQLNFMSGYATEAVAAVGIVKKLDQLPLFFSIGVANGLLPMIAYNHAAGNYERRQRAFRFGCGISLAFSLLCLVFYEIFPGALTGLFIQDQATIEYASVFLRIMVTAMPMMSLCYPLIIQFQAMGRVRESLICSVIRKGVLDIPLLFILNALIPLYGCVLVQPIVDTVSLIVAGFFYKRLKRRGEA